MEKAGGEEGRDESVVWQEIGGMEESRMVQMVMEKLIEDGRIG